MAVSGGIHPSAFLRPGVGDPRWCSHCRHVVKGKYQSDQGGERLVCWDCGRPVRVEESPEDTVAAVLAAYAPEAAQPAETRPESDPGWYAELDPGIRDLVVALNSAGIGTEESCQGGTGHCFPDHGWVSFHGSQSEALRAVAVVLDTPWKLHELRQRWRYTEDGLLIGPEWFLILAPFPIVKPGWLGHQEWHRYQRQHGGAVADTDELDMTPPSWMRHVRPGTRSTGVTKESKS